MVFPYLRSYDNNFIFPSTLGSHDSNKVIIMDSLLINGSKYTEVYKMKDNSVISNGTYPRYVYFTKQYGVIRVEISNGKFYNLVQ